MAIRTTMQGGIKVGAQYSQFISKDNFILAYQRLKTTPRTEYKEFYRCDFRAFELYIDSNIEQLIHNISEGIYEPSNCEKYYMPKKRNLARPITMLSLIDHIVYQALANVIADIFHPAMARYFNQNTFGNIFIATTADNSIFFFEKWKTQWRKFNDQKKQAYNDGFEYSMEFDIASFYDTIDHHILFSILRDYFIEEELIVLLEKCLQAWTISPSNNFSFKKSCGIPQGPICSAFFSEIYLFIIDNEMRKRKIIKYFRYADDISIMAKTEDECKKMVVLLDLLARDLALIPQSEKIEITLIDDIDRHINNVTSRFSQIAKEYQRNDKKLKISTHKKLKKQFLRCFSTGEFNKTIIRFALYKLNKDDM